MINRVWHHHFIKELVETTNDFGVRGNRPSHPELLDCLGPPISFGTIGQ
ncbi:MAG: hypothetical protein M2R46_03511 [Verrucomicrobia subdivision 3 bacterium]|nr:hypothetical protein [Limisphaerales bacterium]